MNTFNASIRHRHKINKKTESINDTTNQLDLTDTKSSTRQAEYILFSNVNEEFSYGDHILDF